MFSDWYVFHEMSCFAARNVKVKRYKIVPSVLTVSLSDGCSRKLAASCCQRRHASGEVLNSFELFFIIGY